MVMKRENDVILVEEVLWDFRKDVPPLLDLLEEIFRENLFSFYVERNGTRFHKIHSEIFGGYCDTPMITTIISF